MRFSKWHALGNSYLLVERDSGLPLDSETARRLCDVRYGIGSDGGAELGLLDLDFGGQPEANGDAALESPEAEEIPEVETPLDEEKPS